MITRSDISPAAVVLAPTTGVAPVALEPVRLRAPRRIHWLAAGLVLLAVTWHTGWALPVELSPDRVATERLAPEPDLDTGRVLDQVRHTVQPDPARAGVLTVPGASYDAAFDTAGLEVGGLRIALDHITRAESAPIDLDVGRWARSRQRGRAHGRHRRHRAGHRPQRLGRVGPGARPAALRHRRPHHHGAARWPSRRRPAHHHGVHVEHPGRGRWRRGDRRRARRPRRVGPRAAPRAARPRGRSAPAHGPRRHPRRRRLPAHPRPHRHPRAVRLGRAAAATTTAARLWRSGDRPRSWPGPKRSSAARPKRSGPCGPASTAPCSIPLPSGCRRPPPPRSTGARTWPSTARTSWWSGTRAATGSSVGSSPRPVLSWAG